MKGLFHSIEASQTKMSFLCINRSQQTLQWRIRKPRRPCMSSMYAFFAGYRKVANKNTNVVQHMRYTCLTMN